jgi:hypothetical protein
VPREAMVALVLLYIGPAALLRLHTARVDLNVCPACGRWSDDFAVAADEAVLVCPACGHRRRFTRLPLFALTGPGRPCAVDPHTTWPELRPGPRGAASLWACPSRPVILDPRPLEAAPLDPRRLPLRDLEAAIAVPTAGHGRPMRGQRRSGRLIAMLQARVAELKRRRELNRVPWLPHRAAGPSGAGRAASSSTRKDPLGRPTVGSRVVTSALGV